MTPDRVRTSSLLVTLKKLSALRAISPANELVTSFKVPPLRIIALAPIATLRRSKVAPLEIVTTPPVSAPKPLLLEMAKVPSLINVAPLYVLLPERIKVPEPTLFREPPSPVMEPDTSAVLASPTVRVQLLRAIVPAPEIDAIRLFAAKLYVAPDATVSTTPSDKPPETVKVPVLTLITPANS